MNRQPQSPAPADLGPLHLGPDHPCPYLPDRTARNAYILVDRIAPDAYLAMMDVGFRRSGNAIYRPVCASCRECRPIRVPVDQFSPSRSQRRILRRNADLSVEIAAPRPSDEKYALFVAYQRERHDGQMDDDPDAFHQFLYHSPTTTLEMTYRLGNRILGIGIVDRCETCLSSVYFYFDPAESRRGLGVFSALREIEECRARGMAYWYAGFYVRGCRRMEYKADYRPYQLLSPDARWIGPASR